ncbi:hypothetical protein D3C72_1791430 [compost metagenome]
MGVAVPGFRIQTYLLECCNDRLFLFRLGAHLVDPQALANDLAHAHPRAQAAERVLKHHLHLPSQRPDLLLRQAV